MLKKTVNGKTTTFTFDGANQLVSSTVDGVTTRYTYDAAGRLVKEDNKTYQYGYLDKVMSFSDGKGKYTYDYHVDGQLARADYGGGKSEDFLWDGLALVKRGGERFINEPHVGGGNPVVSSKGTSYFNDMLGTTLGSKTKGTKYSAAALTAFGEDLTVNSSEAASRSPFPVPHSPFFTGKPHVEGLGHAFLFRNYRAGLAKWQTADPLGYPDGWNQLAYCGNGVISNFDIAGAFMIGYFDLNGGEVPTLVMSANELVVGHTLVGGSQAQDTEGEFFCGIASISRVNGMVLIKIGIAINVVASRHDAEFQPGEKSKFHEHSSEPNDSFMLNPVYEAVVAHERGHATAFFEQWKSLFVSYLNQSNIDDSSIDISILESRVTTAYLAAWAAHTAYSGYLANQYTMDWFDSNPTWERLRNETNSNGDELYVWRKKE